tara:strand:- start:1088 stop:1222 length:135 start_codon:yes stop_codon:yes gene_type:complete
MPKPYPRETKKAFVKRCVSIVIKEGKPAPQAVAICNSIYDNRKV